MEKINVVSNQEKISSPKTELDTIPERNNPESLDLSKQQLFIDTTRTSKFYKTFLNWNPNGRKIAGPVRYYLTKISEKHKPNEINIGDFPRHWFNLKKYKGQYVLYEPCDGNTIAFEFFTDAVIFYYQLEIDADQINKITSVNSNHVEMELNTFMHKSKTEKAKLSIKQTETKNVYHLTYTIENRTENYFVTPKKNVAEFDLMVNHCVREKIAEFNEFDK